MAPTPSCPFQVWYTVPARATAALEEAVRDALPHLVEANPRLLYQLVTALSPRELKVGAWVASVSVPLGDGCCTALCVSVC